MLDDFTKSIRSTLYDRVTSPLFGAFFISWCIWNYKLLFVLASSMPVKDKFGYIENVLFYNLKDVVLLGGIYPIITITLDTHIL